MEKKSKNLEGNAVLKLVARAGEAKVKNHEDRYLHILKEDVFVIGKGLIAVIALLLMVGALIQLFSSDMSVATQFITENAKTIVEICEFVVAVSLVLAFESILATLMGRWRRFKEWIMVVVGLVVGLVVWIMVGLVVWIMVGFVVGLVVWIMVGLVVGLLVGLVVGLLAIFSDD